MARKPDSRAVRRARDHAEIAQTSRAEIVERGISKPPMVAASDNLSELWDLFVGSGIAYKPEDAPLIEQMVFDLELARQCRERCVDESGRIIAIVGCGEPDENGVYADSKPNPWLKQMREATAEAMRIADQMGCTPLARARLGLTQAAGAAVTLSIGDAIDAALKRVGR